MKGYFFTLVLIATTCTLSAGSSLPAIQQSEKNFTEITTQLQDGYIVIYQGLHDTTVEIANVGTAVGILIDARGLPVWTEVIETPDELIFVHESYEVGTYEFVLEKLDGTFIESAFFEMK